MRHSLNQLTLVYANERVVLNPPANNVHWQSVRSTPNPFGLFEYALTNVYIHRLSAPAGVKT